jgi:ferredoxin
MELLNRKNSPTPQTSKTYKNINMKVPVVELSECTLCGICEEVAPSVFRIADAGFVIITELSNYPENDVEEAIKNCPADCIYWEEE